MLILFDLNNVKIAGLTKYKDLSIDKEINVEDTLSFLYPTLDKNTILIQEECYIQTSENKYIVKEVNYSDDDWTQFICKVDIESIKGTKVNYIETTQLECRDCANTGLAGSGWVVGDCTVTLLRDVKKLNCSSYDVLADIILAYGCEITYDAINKKVNIYSSQGSDKGAYFISELNLKKLDSQRTSYDYVTRIIPIGKDGLDIVSPVDGKNYVENYQYSNKIITKFWEDNRYIVSADLKADAITLLKQLSRPYRSYKADIIDLANISDKYSILDYDLGDIITLKSKNDGIVKDVQRIVKLTKFIDEPEKNTIEIANKIISLDQQQVDFQNTSDIVSNLTNSTGTLDGTKIDSIDGSKQIDKLDVTVANIVNLTAINATIEYLDANKANIDDLTVNFATINELKANEITVTQLTAITASIDTLTSFKATITTLIAGNITADNIKAGTITADLMKVGTITAESGIIANACIGTVQIADSSITDGKIVSLTAEKITSGTVDTSKVTILGPNGNLRIANSRIQVFDNESVPVERVSIGDVNGDQTIFGLRIRGSDGVTMLFNENGVTTEGITNGSITNVKISDTANINGSKLLDNSIAGGKLVVDSITAREIAANCITANEILAGTITASQIKANTITANEIAAGTITATQIHAGAITAEMITSGLISGSALRTTNTTSYVYIQDQYIDVVRNSSIVMSIGMGSAFGNYAYIGFGAGCNSSSTLNTISYTDSGTNNPSNGEILINAGNVVVLNSSYSIDIMSSSVLLQGSSSVSITGSSSINIYSPIVYFNHAIDVTNAITCHNGISATAVTVSGDGYFNGVSIGNTNEVHSSGGYTMWVNYTSGTAGLSVGNGSNTSAKGPIYCSSKSSVIYTETYGEVITYCDESPNHVFNDRGYAITDENGMCYIYIDPKLLETVSTKECDYIVMLTSYIEGEVKIQELQPAYFIIKGTPNTRFTWMITAERTGMERLRWNDADIYI